MTRVHFLSSDEPLREGQTAVAQCGAVVPNIVFVYLMDYDAMVSPNDVGVFKGQCHKCLSRKWTGRRIYAFANGQEMRLEEAS